MTTYQDEIEVRTPGRGATEITAAVAEGVRASGVTTGLCIVYCRHTSCSLVIQENADPSARADLVAWLDRIAPDGDSAYTHRAEGPDDMPSHLRAAVTSTSETVPIQGGKLGLGTWQGIFLLEHRTRPHRRRLIIHVMGD